MIDLVGSFKTLQNELCKNLFGWPKGLPSFTSSTLKTKSSLLTFKTTCDLLVLTGVWRPNPRRKNLHRLAFIFDRD